jgi:hypothetical protein
MNSKRSNPKTRGLQISVDNLATRNNSETTPGESAGKFQSIESNLT